MESSIATGNPGQVPADLLIESGNRLETKIRAAQNFSGEKFKGELKAASQEFEAVFIAYLLKVMRATIEESGFFEGGFGKSIYTELFDQEISISIARRGMLGISDLLYQKLSADQAIAKQQDARETPEQEAVTNLQTPAHSSDRQSDTPRCVESEISDLQLPVQGRVSSFFGLRRDPFSHKVQFHKGLDIAAPEGMKVIPALPGTVIYAGYERGYGHTVLLEHSGGIQTRYGHLGAINVKNGDVISPKDILGVVGSSGRSTGPHLHFEVFRFEMPLDPLTRLASRPTAVEQQFAKAEIGGCNIIDVARND